MPPVERKIPGGRLMGESKTIDVHNSLRRKATYIAGFARYGGMYGEVEKSVLRHYISPTSVRENGT